jgi:hypothetical protein
MQMRLNRPESQVEGYYIEIAQAEITCSVKKDIEA